MKSLTKENAKSTSLYDQSFYLKTTEDVIAYCEALLNKYPQLEKEMGRNASLLASLMLEHTNYSHYIYGGFSSVFKWCKSTTGPTIIRKILQDYYDKIEQYEKLK